MTRPKSVTINGEKVVIEWDAKLGLAGHFPKGGDYANNRVRVSHSMLARQEQGTVLHELLHHIWKKSGLGNLYSERTEEVVVSTIDAWLLETLKKNPELVEFLVEEV